MDAISHRHNVSVYFHDIGLAGVDEMETKGWKMFTLAGTMKYLGHENVNNNFYKYLYGFHFNKWVGQTYYISHLAKFRDQLSDRIEALVTHACGS